MKQVLRAVSNMIVKSDLDAVFAEKDMAALLGKNKWETDGVWGIGKKLHSFNSTIFY